MSEPIRGYRSLYAGPLSRGLDDSFYLRRVRVPFAHAEGIDDDPAGLALAEGNNGQIEAAHLVDAGNNLEGALDLLSLENVVKAYGSESIIPMHQHRNKGKQPDQHQQNRHDERQGPEAGIGKVILFEMLENVPVLERRSQQTQDSQGDKA